jgi:uncharacterized protein YaiI (UPF0178 family)
MTSPTVEAQLWRSNYRGDKLEDITDGMLQASVTMDTSNDQTYQLDAIYDYDKWLELAPYIDWIVPELTVSWPDGTVRKGQLGLYILLDPNTTRGETRAYVHLRAMDNLWLLSTQGFDDDELPTTKKALQDVEKWRFVQSILESMIVSEDFHDHVRYALPRTAHKFRRQYEWPIEEKKIDVANEVLEGMGCWPLYSTKKGVLMSRENGAIGLRMQHPVRTYIANVPEGFTVADRILPLGGAASEIVGTIDTDPGFGDLLNTVMIINENSRLGKIYAEKTVTNPHNRRSRMHNRRRKERKHKHNKTVEEQSTADQLATGILDQLSTYNEIIRLPVILDPEPEFAREVIDLLAWDALGRDVPSSPFNRSKYLVHRVSYTFTANDGIMEIEAGRIDTAEGGLAVA